MSWETDVRRAGSAEQRDSLRGARREFLHSYVRNGDMAAFEAAYRSNPIGEWLIADWPAASKAGAVLATDTVLAADVGAFWGDKALIWGSCDDYVVADIDSVGTGGVALSTPVGQAFDNPTVAPVWPARALGGLTISRQNGRWASFGLNWLLTDHLEDEGQPFPQYLGFDFYLCATSAIEPLTGSHYRPVNVLDNAAGPIAVEPARDIADARYEISVIWPTRAETMENQMWFNRLRGRDRPFWVPSWGGSLALASPAGAGATSVLVAPNGQAPSDFTGRHVYFGADQFRQITASADEGGNIRLSFTGALASAATFPKLMRLVRMAGDRVEIGHVRGFYSATKFQVIEVAA